MKKTRKMPANMWAPHEQLILHDAIAKAQASGQTIGYAFKQAATDVNRTASAAAWQWYSVLSKKIKSGEFKPEKVRAELAKKGQATAPKAPVLEVITTTRTKRKYVRRNVTANHVSEAGVTTRKPAKPVTQVDVSTMTYRDITNLVNKLHKVNAQQSVVIAEMKHALGTALNLLNKLESEEPVSAAK